MPRVESLGYLFGAMAFIMIFLSLFWAAFQPIVAQWTQLPSWHDPTAPTYVQSGQAQLAALSGAFLVFILFIAVFFLIVSSREGYQ